MPDRYYARSASDRTNDWPVWIVCDRERGGVNVYGELGRKFEPLWQPGHVTCDREIAERVAELANAIN